MASSPAANIGTVSTADRSTAGANVSLPSCAHAYQKQKAGLAVSRQWDTLASAAASSAAVNPGGFPTYAASSASWPTSPPEPQSWQELTHMQETSGVIVGGTAASRGGGVTATSAVRASFIWLPRHLLSGNFRGHSAQSGWARRRSHNRWRRRANGNWSRRLRAWQCRWWGHN